MNDQKIVELLKEKKQDKAFAKLYHYFPKVEKLILSKGGSKEDALDIYQEALIIFYRKATAPGFELTSAIGTYLYSVCRFLWKDELIKKNKHHKTDFNDDFSVSETQDLSEAIEKERKIELAESIIAQLGEKCKKLIVMFYYKSMRMAEIAKKLGFKSEKIAKNQKYKCMERARQQLQQSAEA